MLADAVIALTLVAMLGAVLMVLANRHARATRELGATRAAVRMAEAALMEMQGGRPAPASVRVRRLTPAAEGAVWVEVTAAVEGREVALIGLVRESAAGGAEGGGP
jgi:hypothetical protein